MSAAKHVKAARSQKLLAQEKIESAKSACQQSAEKSNIITLVVDYCQNLDLPHLGGEQPGDTYYLSPIWLYCLGIVNVAEEKLYAYIYEECLAKNGMNNVASLLMHYINNYLLNLHQRAYLCEVGYFKKVNFVFLVKGHTKNSADRMFNLLKLKWHKMQV